VLSGGIPGEWSSVQGIRSVHQFRLMPFRTNEIPQCRAALSQLLEYRFFYGTDEDRLCLIVDRSIADRRRAVLESLGVGVAVFSESGALQPVGQHAIDLLGREKQR
jgi:hypothetical protein